MWEGGGEWMGEVDGEQSFSLALIEEGYPWQFAWFWVVEASHLKYLNA